VERGRWFYWVVDLFHRVVVVKVVDDDCWRVDHQTVASLHSQVVPLQVVLDATNLFPVDLYLLVVVLMVVNDVLLVVAIHFA
tara:strand:- start:1519 stop:1764 length:246 start_codon:yes stop_codon:yes gene_type:complete